MDERRRKEDTLYDELLGEKRERIVDQIKALKEFNEFQFKNIETTANYHFTGINKRLDILNGSVVDNRKRIVCLENWKWYLLGGGGAFAAIVTIIEIARTYL